MIPQISLYPSVSLGNNTLLIQFLSAALSNSIPFLPTEVSVNFEFGTEVPLFKKKKTCLFLAALGLLCCTQVLSNRGE